MTQMLNVYIRHHIPVEWLAFIAASKFIWIANYLHFPR